MCVLKYPNLSYFDTQYILFNSISIMIFKNYELLHMV